MSIISIDGNLLKKLIIAGANELSRNKELVDSLNVFPVPDGDTGTNMSLTVLSAAKEVEKLNTPNIYDVAKVASNGALRGARGNSGVIVSQLFRGFAKGLEGVSVANVDNIADALSSASIAAYKAVMKPKEGTILTVARALGEKAEEVAMETDDIIFLLEKVLKYGNEVLIKTEEMLPELKRAGVVDAGGKGLICIIEGALASFSVDGEIAIEDIKNGEEVKSNIFDNISTDDIKFAYCTEFFINSSKHTNKTETVLKNFLSSIGDSIVLVVDDEIIKIHVHTNQPGRVLEKALSIGTLSNIKIENMKEQHTSKISFVEKGQDVKEIEIIEEKIEEEEKEIGFVVVSTGAGLKNLFLSLGADQIIEGGQTMNPSADDILKAVNKVNARNVIVLPNNKNIVMAAEQAKILSHDKNITVIPSKTIPQGISALVNFIAINDLDENIESMTGALSEIKSAQVTYAVRDTTMEDNKEIKKGDFLCMNEGKISFVSKDLQEGTKELISSMIVDGSEFISIYYGEDTTKEQADGIAKYLNENYSDCEVEVQNGTQPLYYYIISVE